MPAPILPTAPISAWSPEDLQRWFNSFKDGRFSNHAASFKGLAGPELAELAKDDFLRRAPEVGDVLYNEVFKLRQLATQQATEQALFERSTHLKQKPCLSLAFELTVAPSRLVHEGQQPEHQLLQRLALSRWRV